MPYVFKNFEYQHILVQFHIFIPAKNVEKHFHGRMLINL